MGGEAPATDASTPDWQPIIIPDMTLYSISAWKPMTKNTELYQTLTENEMLAID